MFVLELICRYGCPGEIKIVNRWGAKGGFFTDNGSEFCNQVMSLIVEELGFPYNQIVPGRPQGQGQVERYVGLLKRNLRHHMAEHGNGT